MPAACAIAMAFPKEHSRKKRLESSSCLLCWISEGELRLQLSCWFRFAHSTFAAFVSCLVESVGVSLGVKSGTEVQLLQAVLALTRCSWAPRSSVLGSDLKPLEMLCKFKVLLHIRELKSLEVPPGYPLFPS